MDDEPGFKVTVREVFEEMRELTRGVQELTQELKESRKTDADHEGRLRVVERWMWGLPVAIVGMVVANIAAFMK
ncbi:hypothetical protein GCM10018965_084310 [Nonomuraea roseola]